MTVEKDLGADSDVARRFQSRMVEIARQGHFGGLRTRNAGLQSAYAHLLSLLDNPEVPVAFYGERGSGKRRHVDELLVIHNFFRKLQGAPQGKLRVFRGDFVSTGFTRLLSAPASQPGDLVYLEGVDLLSLECQAELLGFLKNRKSFADQGLPLPRIVIGTERALSMLVLLNQFNRDLFGAITGFAVFLPPLRERPEDVPHLLQALAEDLSGRAQTPSSWLVDFVTQRDWDGNIGDLQKFLREGLLRNPSLAQWSAADLPPSMQPRANFGDFRPVGTTEAERIREALVAAQGDRKQCARLLGFSYGELLQKMVGSGLR